MGFSSLLSFRINIEKYRLSTVGKNLERFKQNISLDLFRLALGKSLSVELLLLSLEM